ncbi:MAG: aspartate--tRNA ligase [Christensenellaceae bacterium]|nr:aspartate--tRNA ligase [Christensenellaceae bacterium]
MATYNQSWARSCMCGEVSKESVNKNISLLGWVQRVRNIGGIIFLWLRDRSGMVQVVFNQENLSEDIYAMAESLRSEYVIGVRGEVALRDESAINPEMETGEIEVNVSELVIFNAAQTPPIYIEDDAKDNEAVRLKYRYLDLRKPSVQKTLFMRAKIISAIRNYMDSQGFIEVETPILTKSTPEGARDFLVPSRIHPGECYALPQSPQIYKQLLMVGGFDRYYQIAKCFRDEDSRADRQPEFTQLDMEMSFVEPRDVQTVIEGAFNSIFTKVLGTPLSLPLPRITWKEALERYGSDKPDTRFEMYIQDVSDTVKECGFSVFESAVSAGNMVCGITAKGQADNLSRKQIDALTDYAKTYHVKGLAWYAINSDGTIRSSFAKFMSDESLNRLISDMDCKSGDIMFFIADKRITALTAMGQLRLKLGKDLDLIDTTRNDLFWVTEFPLFEYSEEDQRYVAAHHPFTMPMDEDFDLIDTNPHIMRAKSYDLVMNGIEMGSGSVRIHSSDIQERMFNMLGFTKEEAWKRFGFLLEAFKYGTPPHGGFAFGIDRLIMALSGKESLRDVIAFPKAQNASCPMMATPSSVPEEQLKQLHIKFELD